MKDCELGFRAVDTYIEVCRDSIFLRSVRGNFDGGTIFANWLDMIVP